MQYVTASGASPDRDHVDSLLVQLVARLKTRDTVRRNQYARELYNVVATLSRQLSAETYAKALQQLTPQLYALLQAPHEHEQLGGLAAIDLLIALSPEDQIIRFANYLRNFLAQPHTSRTALWAAAAALGHLARANTTSSGVSGTLVAAFVDFEVKRAFEWLQGDRQEALFRQRRLAACVVLRELAQAAPTLFHVNLTTFFQSIWGAVRDPKVEIREAAVAALSACLQLIAKRQTRHRVQWYCKVYDQVLDGLNLPGRGGSSGGASTNINSGGVSRVTGTASGMGATSAATGTTPVLNRSNSGSLLSMGSASAPSSTLTASSLSLSPRGGPTTATMTVPPTTASWECVHGSLLVIGELLQNTGGFMLPRFREVCDTVLLYKDTKDKLVGRTVCVLLPSLAEFCPDAFIRYYLVVAIGHLMKRVTTFTTTGERGIAFLALGEMSLAIGEHVLPHVPALVKLVKESLAQTTTRGKRRSKNKLYCVETLTCVAYLSRALREKFEPYLTDLLEIMMQGGLSDELIDALSAIVESVPSCLTTVQERLLNEISVSLRGVPFSSTRGDLGHGGMFISESTTYANGDKASGSASAAMAHAQLQAQGTPPPPSKPPTVVQALLSSVLQLGGVSSAASSPLASATASPTASFDDEKGLSGSAMTAFDLAGDSVFGNPSVDATGTMASRMGSSSAYSSSLAASIANASPSSSSWFPVLRGESPEAIEMILLALRTLGCFDFSGNFCLLPFVRDCVALYWKNPDARVRQQAVITSAQLLLPSSTRQRGDSMASSSDTNVGDSASWRHVTKRGPSGRVIDALLLHLLRVGTSDMDFHVRQSVVESLDERYDELLSQETHLTALLTLLNDEVPVIRERTMQLLERLTPRNPAFVMPALRRMLIQVLTELEHAGTDTRMQEEATRLLGYLIRGAQHLIDPYIVRVLEALLPMLARDGNASLASAALVTVGELALVTQQEMAVYEGYVFPLILYTLQDHSSIDKRQLALQTMGQLAGSTSCVVRPYLAFPKLLEILLSMLQHSAATPWPLRREAMKTIGILGALDPYKYKLCISRASMLEANDAVDAGNGIATDPVAKNAANSTAGTGSSVAGAPTSVHQSGKSLLDLDLTTLGGLKLDMSRLDRAHALIRADVLDEKQQIELQLFTAAPIGTRRADGSVGSSRSGENGEPGGVAAAQASAPVAGVGSAVIGGSGRSAAAAVTHGAIVDGGILDFERLLPDEHDVVLDASDLSPAAEAYFPTVAISALLKILKEPSLSMHHHGVIQAIMFVFKSLHTQCVPFLPSILPPFLRVLARGEPRLRESLFLQLTTLIGIVDRHMAPFFPSIMVLALRFWSLHLPQIIRLIEKMSHAAPTEFRVQYFPQLLPKILSVLQPHGGNSAASAAATVASGGSVAAGGGAASMGSGGAGGMSDGSNGGSGVLLVNTIHTGASGVGSVGGDHSGSMMAGAGDSGTHGHGHGASASALGGSGGVSGGDKVGDFQSVHLHHQSQVVAALQIQVVQALVVFRDAVDEYVYLLVPALLRLMESVDTPLDVKVVTIYALARIALVTKFEHYAGARVLQPLARVARQVTTKGSFFSSSSASHNAAVPSPSSASPARSSLGGGGGGSHGNMAGGLGMGASPPRSTSTPSLSKLATQSSTNGTASGTGPHMTQAVAVISASKSEAKTFSEALVFALAALAVQLQAEFINFEPLVSQIVRALPHHHESSTMEMLQKLAQAVDRLRCGELLDAAWLLDDPVFLHNASLRAIALANGFGAASPGGHHHHYHSSSSASAAVSAASAPASAASNIMPSNGVRLHVNQQNLRRAWEASQRSTKDDWLEWMRRFSIELLRESPSAALRSCCALAQAYNPLARELFNPAFVSCWNELYEQYQDYLVRALETAFQSETIPAEILQTLLNLAEFMEHDVEALPIDIRELGELAQKCHAYAKALHYKELEFHTSPATCIEALISINNQLGQPEAAAGILKYAQQHHTRVVHVQETWYEKLQDWSAALELYDSKLAALGRSEVMPSDVELWVGKMRCLEALGEWEALSTLATHVYSSLQQQQHRHHDREHGQQPVQRGVHGDRSAVVRRTSSGGSSSLSGSSMPPRHGSLGSAPPSAALLSRHGSFTSTSGVSSGAVGSDDRADFAMKQITMLGAKASWWLGQWDQMAVYVDAAGGRAHNKTIGTSFASSQHQHHLHHSMPGAVSSLLGDDMDTESTLFRAVLAVHHNQFAMATALIDETRSHLDARLGALVGESYSRAYRSMVTLQQLSELEEIVTYKKLRVQVSKTEEAARYKRHLVRMWHARLQTGCKRVVEVWQQILAVRSLIVAPHEDIDTWLQFASLCRQSGNLSMSLKVFTNALAVNTTHIVDTARTTNGMSGFSSSSSLSGYSSVSASSVNSALPGELVNVFGYGEREHHRVAFAYLKHLWTVGDKKKALHELQSLVGKLASSSTMQRNRMAPMGVPHGGGGTMNQRMVGSGNREEDELVVKCHLKLAEWQLAIHEQQLDRVAIPNILTSLKLCTELEPSSYKAWHAWALMNFHVVEHFTSGSGSAAASFASSSLSMSSSNGSNSSSMATSAAIGPYIAPAIEGFFRSIALGRSRWAANVQQDILRVLTLWFAYGNRMDVHQTLVQGFSSVSIETWLIVIPQLIARIHSSDQRIQTQLHRLLSAIGTQHPHALIYPLSVALKSPLQERQRAAEAIMNTMRRHYVELVDEALLVSRELIRVAILWHEMWHEGLEEASRLYFGEHDVDGMVAVLAPLHEMMEHGPETLREVSFQQTFGRDLREANEWLQRFLHGNRKSESEVNRAWDLYYHVFRRINKQLPQLTMLELQYVSPNLLQARNLQLVVPGTYRAGHGIVTIGKFLPTIHVITSKQRPRRITIVGSNGLEYMFLLKGHEDLRQDERVMQLFGLVNALLINDRTTSKKDLQIHRYPVIPLSHNAGIVGWMPHCDTLHQLIRDYREARKILLNIEHRLMLQMAPEYDALSLLHKVEVFEYALENTAGQDLYKVLWLKSENSEVWLDRRTNYTRSLAVMSMVGYILGLGDRHPSNLMLHRFTGTIAHIDFGDCFEVAMHRDKYPEKIPFRLTRMLTNAMEVSGIEGNFRFSCESVMAVLRENRHSLMAMLEAFVHDPLINWRLLAPTQKDGGASPSHASQGSHSSFASYTSYASHASRMGGAGPSQATGDMVVPTSMANGVTPRAQTSTREDHRVNEGSQVVSEPADNATNDEPKTHSEGATEEKDSTPSTANAREEQAEDGGGYEDEEVRDGDEEEQGADEGEETDEEDEDTEDDAEDDDDVAESLSSSAVMVSRMPRRPPPVRTHRSASDAAPPVATTRAIPGGIASSMQRSRPKMVASSMRTASALPPRPAAASSVSTMAGRPMSVSKSIAFTRTLPQRSQPTSASGSTTAPSMGGEQDTEPVEQIDHTTTNLHAEIASLAASVTEEGQFSLRRKFSQSAAEAASVSTMAPQTRTTAQPPLPQSQQKQQRDGGKTSQPVQPGLSSSQAPGPIAGAAAVQSSLSQSKSDVHANRTHRERELVHALGPEGAGAPREALNEKAVAVIRRVQSKLTGRDFEGEKEPLGVSAQVQRLIDQAASHENLCQCYIGWCPFW